MVGRRCLLHRFRGNLGLLLKIVAMIVSFVSEREAVVSYFSHFVAAGMDSEQWRGRSGGERTKRYNDPWSAGRQRG